MEIDKKIKEVLTLIKDGNFNPKTVLPKESREEVIRILNISEDENFLSHSSKKQQPLVTKMMSGAFMLHPTTFVTRAGEQFIEGYDRSKNQSQTTFNIESVTNSALGNYNTVNNYSEQPLDDLLKLVESLDFEDRKEGKELIDTLKNDEAKPGYLSRFESFFKNYPKTIDLISSFLTSVFISKIS